MFGLILSFCLVYSGVKPVMNGEKPENPVAESQTGEFVSFAKILAALPPQSIEMTTLLPTLGLYQNVRLINLVLDIISDNYTFLFSVETIGFTPQGNPIRAVHVYVPTLGPRPDDAERPGLFVECNMHGREWAAGESCIRFIERLLAAWILFPIQTILYLQDVHLWIVPMVNPDGRIQDDPAYNADPSELWSDPLWYWNNTFWHNGDVSGWRQNVQWVDCDDHTDGYNYGIDLARNFSSGWTDASANCLSNQYRGGYPFQAVEANIMRQFVNNRMISMSLTVHSFGGSIRSLFDGYDPVKNIRDNFKDYWNDALSYLPNDDFLVIKLDTDGPAGGGYGQFSSWLAGRSNTSGELDFDTRRRINSFYLELAPNPNSYYGSSYQDADGDGSNSFHPSAAAFITDMSKAFMPALAYFIRQAQYPWCDIDPVTLLPNNCADVGLTGSKIAAGTHAIGVLSFLYTGTSSYEWTAEGTYGAVYRVQNFYTTEDVEVEVEVKIESKNIDETEFIVEEIFTHTHMLGPGEYAVGGADDSFHYYQADKDYKVTITLCVPETTDDNIPGNNKHVFRFRVL